MPRVVPDRLAQEPHEGRASWTLKVLSCFADSPSGWDPSGADTRGSRRGSSRSCFLEFGEGQQPARGASSLPGATSEWPLRRTDLPEPAFLRRKSLRVRLQPRIECGLLSVSNEPNSSVANTK